MLRSRRMTRADSDAMEKKTLHGLDGAARLGAHSPGRPDPVLHRRRPCGWHAVAGDTEPPPAISAPGVVLPVLSVRALGGAGPGPDQSSSSSSVAAKVGSSR